MKIGIITYHRALNYGAVLQAFALTEFLRSLGYNAEIIDYRCAKIESDYYKVIPSNAKTLRQKFGCLLRFIPKKKRAIQFRNFELSKKFLSEKTFDKQTISNANMDYDVFISGSDQVWNNYGSDSDFNYLLEFVNDSKRMIAYSASFGYENIPDCILEDYKRLLNRFDDISVREKSGANIVKNTINEEVYVTCDPVFLLDAEYWKRKLNISSQIEKEYLLVYFLSYNEKALAYAVEYASKNRLKVVVVNNIQKSYCGVEMLKYVSPERFVSLFANAKLVLTDSFHGTAFSIIFNKPFNTFVSDVSRVSSRIKYLLDRVELSSHIVSEFNMINWLGFDYVAVNEEIKKYREESIKYLRSSLIQ